MKEFMMIFRMAPIQNAEFSPEQMQESIKQWNDWMGGIAAQGKLAGGNQLGFTGKTLHASGVVTDGPYAELKEIVGGYIIVKAEDLDQAFAMASGCPILFVGGNVEVRDVMQSNA